MVQCNLGDNAMDVPVLRLSVADLSAGVTVKPYTDESHAFFFKNKIEQIVQVYVK